MIRLWDSKEMLHQRLSAATTTKRYIKHSGLRGTIKWRENTILEPRPFAFSCLIPFFFFVCALLFCVCCVFFFLCVFVLNLFLLTFHSLYLYFLPPLFFFKFWLRQKLKPSLVFIFICVLLFCLRLSLLGHRTGGLVRAKREQPGTMGN